jgi:hypothetical protein
LGRRSVIEKLQLEAPDTCAVLEESKHLGTVSKYAY